MASSADWRDGLGFSERLSSIQEISSALKNVNSEHEREGDKPTPTALEQNVYAQSKSKVEYDELISSILVQFAVRKRADEARVDGDEVEDGGPLVRIGSFHNAKYLLHTPSSTVYRASSGSPGPRVVALKVTHPSREPLPHDSRKEVALLQNMSHRSILPLLRTEKLPDSGLMLVFPYMPVDLANHLSKPNKLSKASLKKVLQDILSALEYLHGNSIIHRDIKPSNILLNAQLDSAYLVDFGTAWSPKLSAAAEPPGKMNTDVGTSSYRAPELLFGNHSYGTSLDMWAFGCVAFELLSSQKEPLFDSGDLGSELALISSIFRTLGTPNDATWPEARQFPDWGKMSFTAYDAKPWTKVLPDSSEEGQLFVAGLVRYQSTERMTAKAALAHAFLENCTQ